MSKIEACNKIKAYRRNKERIKGSKNFLYAPSMLKNFFEIFALLAIISIVLGVTFDFAYFLNLGVDTTAIPISATEHLRSLIVYLPKFIIFLGAPLVIIVYFSCFKPQKGQEVSYFNKVKFWLGLIFLCSTVFILYYVFFGLSDYFNADNDSFFLLVYAFLFIFMMTVWFLNSLGKKFNVSTKIKLYFLMFVIGFLLSFFYGLYSSHDSYLDVREGRYTLKAILEGTGRDGVEVQVMRSFENVVLVYQDGVGTFFINRDHIDKIIISDKAESLVQVILDFIEPSMVYLQVFAALVFILYFMYYAVKYFFLYLKRIWYLVKGDSVKVVED